MCTKLSPEMNPGAHVVYVDYDPVVVNHARALLVRLEDSITAVVQAISAIPERHPGPSRA